MNTKDTRDFLRHTVATVAYRGEKSVRDAPENFADFKIGENSRTPAQILAHIGDLFDWALSMVKGEQSWQNSTPMNWEDEANRFFTTLQNLTISSIKLPMIKKKVWFSAQSNSAPKLSKHPPKFQKKNRKRKIRIISDSKFQIPY